MTPFNKAQLDAAIKNLNAESGSTWPPSDMSGPFYTGDDNATAHDFFPNLPPEEPWSPEDYGVEVSLGYVMRTRPVETRRVWRWRVKAYDQVVPGRGLVDWLRPLVVVEPLVGLMEAAVARRSSKAMDAVTNSNALLRHLGTDLPHVTINTMENHNG